MGTHGKTRLPYPSNTRLLTATTTTANPSRGMRQETCGPPNCQYLRIFEGIGWAAYTTCLSRGLPSCLGCGISIFPSVVFSPTTTQRLDPLVPARGCTTTDTQKKTRSNDAIVTLPHIAHSRECECPALKQGKRLTAMCPAVKRPFSQGQGIPSCPEDKPFYQLMWLDTRNNL